MKKTWKRLGAIFLAMAMAVSVLCTGAMADETNYTITINGKSAGHTYEAYRVFTGDLTKISDANGETKAVYSLANIQWDSDVINSDALLKELQDDETLKTDNTADFATCRTAEDVANVLSTNKDYTGTDAKKTQEFATLVGKNLKPDAKHTDSKETDNTTYTISVPAGYYFIKDKADSLDNTTDKAYTRYILEVVGPQTVNSKDSVPTLEKEVQSAENQWGNVNDNQIGDTVNFRLRTSVPDITGYATYTYQIDDTMSTGLTSNVVADNTNNNVSIKVNDQTDLDKQYYTVTVDNDNSNHFTVTVKIKDAIDAGVIKSGDTLYTYYSGVLNEKANSSDETEKNNTNTAKLIYSNDPNGTGTTTDKKVYDWTFKIALNKVDKTAGTKLDGAKFVLSKSDNLTGLAEDNVENNTSLISLIKNDTDSTYTVATANTTETTTKIIEAGSINIKGLDADTDYYLYEITAPDGYNKLNKPVHFKIEAKYTEDGSALQTNYPTITVDEGTASADLTVKVENSSGKLPSTGGMGTTLFYVIGGALMAGAAIVLVIKKKRSSAE